MNVLKSEYSKLAAGQTPGSQRTPFPKGLLVCWFAALLICQAAQAAPFRDLHVSFTQPDGTKIEVVGWGDEFSAVFETLDGYTVIFDPALKAYCFAQQGADGNLVSTGVQVHRAQASALGLGQHLRPTDAALQEGARARRERWEAGMKIEQRWKERKAAQRQMSQAAGSSGLASKSQTGPPPNPTIGNVLGLTLLIDFDDDPATMSQGEIANYCNSDNYTNYDNNGSIKKYFQDNSDDLLIYSNVVTVYIRVPNTVHPKSYYNDTAEYCGDQANLLIADAISIMKALTNYNTDILPTFTNLTVDGANYVVAFNVFYAGDNGGVWNYGLWPHSWALYNTNALELSLGGKKVYHYQISNIGTSLAIGTFCHENGHMLCGYPDLYDYSHRSYGDGDWSLMADGNFDQNPVQIDAYLKSASGWATNTELTSPSLPLTAVVTATPGANFNHFYRYQKPGVSTEYFLMECRYQTNHDALLHGSGVLVWHIDELGSNFIVNLDPNTIHSNFEATVVQADSLWHLERKQNRGDANDPYYSGNAATGYTNLFTDATTPNAHWWDGTASGIRFRDFSAPATTMSFFVGNVVFVDAAYTAGDSDGSLAKPFRTVAEGYQATIDGDIIRIFSTNYAEALNMSKVLRLEATNGVVRIGSP
jgi:M6 family metalloprotease-like protein